MKRRASAAAKRVDRCAALAARATLVVAIALFVFHSAARAQSQQGEGADAQVTTWAFFGGFTSHNLANPGLHVGAEYPLAITPRFRSLAAASFQAYHQKNTQAGYALHARWGQRYTASFGFTFDDYLGIGAQLTRYDTTTFEFQDSVAVTKHDSEVRIGFTPHFVFGPGYDFDPLTHIPLHLYARPGVILLYPDLNLAYQVAVILELGLRWSPRL